MTAPQLSDPATRVQIVGYNPAFKQAFFDLNIAWLEHYFTVEPVHRRALENPENEIIEGGGEIFFARRGADILGTVAVRADGNGVYELTKLGVSPAAQGLGLGRALCEAVINWFQARQGRTLYLETHTKLEAAMALYRKLDFELMEKPADAHYEGTDCYMVWRGDKA